MATYLDEDALARIYSVEEFEPIARGNMTEAGYSYVSGAAGTGGAHLANLEAYRRWVFRLRALVDVSRIEIATTLLGQDIALPLVFAPSALHKLAHPDGELATARAAERLGTLMVVSTGGSIPLEDVAREVTRKWFQLYWFTDRELTRELVQRAEASGYQAICLTVDTPVAAWREHELRLPLFPYPGIESANLPETADTLEIEGSLTWRSLEWLRSITRLPIVTKGVLTPEDASLAVEHGVDAIIVSNHGGRQLDSSMATLDALAPIVDAVGSRAEVLVDGGIRRGTDVLKALALGARCVLLGRPVFWGLATAGEDGLVKMIELIRGELVSAMGHTGQTSVETIDRSAIAPNPALVPAASSAMR
jgi:4-hydroxymandelate oxidase